MFVLSVNSKTARVLVLAAVGIVAEVIIPSEFDDTYKAYNEIQKKQGFDLEKYKGSGVKRWTYEIKNYPGYAEDSGCIRANMLVCDGKVIGGDICSVELDGFMHGFQVKENAA